MSRCRSAAITISIAADLLERVLSSKNSMIILIRTIEWRLSYGRHTCTGRNCTISCRDRLSSRLRLSVATLDWSFTSAEESLNTLNYLVNDEIGGSRLLPIPMPVPSSMVKSDWLDIPTTQRRPKIFCVEWLRMPGKANPMSTVSLTQRRDYIGSQWTNSWPPW